MKRFMVSTGLMCLLSISTLAGEIPSVPGPQPPPPGIASAPGDIPISGIAAELSSEALDTLLAALTFLTV
jgi:hypothetical protein